MHLFLATADDLNQAINGKLGDTVAIDTLWVMIAAILVLFMQAGFAMLEIGFSRMKNAGTGVANGELSLRSGASSRSSRARVLAVNPVPTCPA